MIKVAFVRGAFMNGFEGQNYDLSQENIELTGISALKNLGGSVPFPVMKIRGLTDMLPVQSRTVRAIANRTIGDLHVLFGLERYASQFDIFHTADPYYFYSYQLARLRKQGRIRRLIVTWWETIAGNNESVSRKKEIKRFTMQQADRFLCYSEKASKCLMEEGVKPGKISIIPLGVNLSRFHASSSGMAKKGVTLLFVGRLVEEKGLLDAYKAYLIARRKVEGIICLKLRIIGQGALENALMERVRKDGLVKDVSIQSVPYSCMHEVYRSCDIFIVPSRSSRTWEEQYGMVFIEAMASGLPVISYRTGAIPEVVGNAGFLYREGDISGLASGIVSLCDIRRRKEIGTIGVERTLKRYDSRKTARKLAVLYRSL